jgi:methyl-accepting chemotaxis protein
MLKLSNMTIKEKIVSIIMLVSLSVLVLTGFILLGYLHITFRNSMVQDILTDAHMTADNCNIALAFRNVEDVERTLASLESKSSIVFGGVYTVDGDNFANYFREDFDSSAQPKKLKKDGYYFGNGFLTVFKSIELDNEKIGTLCIRSDLKPLYVIFKNSTTVISIVLILALLMAYFLSAKLQKIISESILDLAEVAKFVSEKKDYSARAIKKSSDEVGLLIDAFNEMLEQIQHRDSILLDTNEQLTKEVSDRKKAEEALEKLNKDL